MSVGGELSFAPFYLLNSVIEIMLRNRLRYSKAFFLYASSICNSNANLKNRTIIKLFTIFAEIIVDMDKKELRAAIKALKKQHSKEQLMEQSERILVKLEQHTDFVNAKRVMLYNALPDEVQTQAFLEKWHLKKQIILPTVVGDDIVPVEYEKDTEFSVGDFNILEPQNKPYLGGFDLIVVPGVAFDRHGNRIGRGRGYYDRFLRQHLEVKRIGICFDFQLVEEVPTEPFDIRMDEVISEA